MLTRKKNPLAQQLSQSQCIFEWRGPYFDCDALTTLGELKTLGFSIDQLSDGHLEARISHSIVDAFGGVLLLRSLLPNQAQVDALSMKSERTIDDDHYHVFSFECYGQKTQTNERTLTQIFLSSLIIQFELKSEQIALAVCMDDISQLTNSSALGNSLSIVQCQAQRLLHACLSSGLDWRRFLNLRAERALKVTNQSALDAPLGLISSLGDLSRFSWCPDLGGYHFKMYPTPGHRDTANVVIWSYKERHVISVVANANHLFTKHFDELAHLWRVLFNES
jgi:hypothetical protein